MPKIQVNNATLYYEEAGTGPETIVFSHSLLMNNRHFIYQTNALKEHYRCLAYDHRGHGDSEITENGYDMNNLVLDAVGFIEAMNCAPCHFIGLSMGGYIGMEIAVTRPELIKSLIIMDTPAELGKHIPLFIKKSILSIPELLGIKKLPGFAIKTMFGKKFLKDPERKGEVLEWKEFLQTVDLSAIIKIAKGLVSWEGVYNRLNTIRIPVLIINGEKDFAVPLSQGKKLQNAIQGSKLVTIPYAGHISSFEEPEAVNEVVCNFLKSLRSDGLN